MRFGCLATVNRKSTRLNAGGFDVETPGGPTEAQAFAAGCRVS
jgi:hypothetical protein